MMKELSMHILDIANNSVRAKSKEVLIRIEENIFNNTFIVIINDNGIGMDPEFLEAIKNPFVTTRTFRKVGLGIPLLNDTCIQCDGELKLTSEKGVGTSVKARMQYNNIDRPPLGDIASTITTLISSNPEINIVYEHVYEQNEFSVSTSELIEILGDEVSLSNIQIQKWLKDYIKSNVEEIKNH